MVHAHSPPHQPLPQGVSLPPPSAQGPALCVPCLADLSVAISPPQGDLRASQGPSIALILKLLGSPGCGDGSGTGPSLGQPARPCHHLKELWAEQAETLHPTGGPTRPLPNPASPAETSYACTCRPQHSSVVGLIPGRPGRARGFSPPAAKQAGEAGRWAGEAEPLEQAACLGLTRATPAP